MSGVKRATERTRGTSPRTIERGWACDRPESPRRRWEAAGIATGAGASGDSPRPCGARVAARRGRPGPRQELQCSTKARSGGPIPGKRTSPSSTRKIRRRRARTGSRGCTGLPVRENRGGQHRSIGPLERRRLPVREGEAVQEVQRVAAGWRRTVAELVKADSVGEFAEKLDVGGACDQHVDCVVTAEPPGISEGQIGSASPRELACDQQQPLRGPTVTREGQAESIGCGALAVPAGAACASGSVAIMRELPSERPLISPWARLRNSPRKAMGTASTVAGAATKQWTIITNEQRVRTGTDLNSQGRRRAMQAILLAGGKGTRLRPFTVTIPKPLLPLGELPIVEVVIRQLAWPRNQTDRPFTRASRPSVLGNDRRRVAIRSDD